MFSSCSSRRKPEHVARSHSYAFRGALVSLSLVALSFVALSCVAAPALSAQERRPVRPRTDSLSRDSTRQATLVPVRVTERRERSVPPPVITIRLDTAAVHSAPSTTAYDLVRRVSGLEVHEQGQGPGFTSNVVVRGFNSDHSADALLVIDGVPINSPIHGHVEGFADWNVLLPAAVSDMRFVAGAASPQYGDFALAGVMEVFTAADARGTSASVQSSSFGDVAAWARTGRRGERGGVLGALDVRRQQGWQQNAQYGLGNGLVRGWRAVKGGRLEGGAQWYGSDWNSPGFVSVGRYNTRDLRTPVDSTDGGRTRRVILSARYGRTIGTLRGRAIGLEATSWAQRSQQRMYLNVPGEGSIMRQSEENDARHAVGGQMQVAWPLRVGEILTGLSARQDVADYSRFTTFARARSSLDHSYDADFASQSGFVRWRTMVGSRIGVDVGARIDALTYSALDRVAEANSGVALAPLRATRVIGSPKLGARYALPWAPAGLSLTGLASTSRGFRGAPGVIADPTRAPVTAWSHELGLDAERRAFRLHLALFRLDARNERVFNPVTLGVSSAGQSRRQGLDLRASWRAASPEESGRRFSFRIPGGTELFSSLTLNDARFLGELPAAGGVIVRPVQNGAFHDHNIPILPGDRVPGVAAITGRIGADGPWRASFARASAVDGARWRVSYRLLGSFVPIGEPGLHTRPASLLDLGVRLPLPSAWSGRAAMLDLDLENVLNLRYVENRASGFITPGLPRVVRVGLRFP